MSGMTPRKSTNFCATACSDCKYPAKSWTADKEPFDKIECMLPDLNISYKVDNKVDLHVVKPG